MLTAVTNVTPAQRQASEVGNAESPMVAGCHCSGHGAEKDATTKVIELPTQFATNATIPKDPAAKCRTKKPKNSFCGPRQIVKTYRFIHGRAAEEGCGVLVL